LPLRPNLSSARWRERLAIIDVEITAIFVGAGRRVVERITRQWRNVSCVYTASPLCFVTFERSPLRVPIGMKGTWSAGRITLAKRGAWSRSLTAARGRRDESGSDLSRTSRRPVPVESARNLPRRWRFEFEENLYYTDNKRICTEKRKRRGNIALCVRCIKLHFAFKLREGILLRYNGGITRMIIMNTYGIKCESRDLLVVNRSRTLLLYIYCIFICTFITCLLIF